MPVTFWRGRLCGCRRTSLLILMSVSRSRSGRLMRSLGGDDLLRRARYLAQHVLRDPATQPQRRTRGVTGAEVAAAPEPTSSPLKLADEIRRQAIGFRAALHQSALDWARSACATRCTRWAFRWSLRSRRWPGPPRARTNSSTNPCSASTERRFWCCPRRGVTPRDQGQGGLAAPGWAAGCPARSVPCGKRGRD